MSAALQTDGVCNMCNQQLGSRCNRFGRRVEHLEEPLRRRVAECEVVCDECLRSKQPILRSSGPPWARTAWSTSCAATAPLCARNGWDCPNQRQESKKTRTTALKACKLFQSTNPRYYLDKYNVPQYAAPNCLCNRCYKEIYKAEYSVTPTTPSTPASTEASQPSAKRARAPTTITDADVVSVLRELPADTRSRIAALIAHKRDEMKQTDISNHLGLADPDSGTFRRPDDQTLVPGG